MNIRKFGKNNQFPFIPKCRLLYIRKHPLFLYGVEILLIPFTVIIGAFYSHGFVFLWMCVCVCVWTQWKCKKSQTWCDLISNV